MKVVINTCHGGFGLSDEAISEYIKRKGLNLHKHGRSYYIVPYREYRAELEVEQEEFRKMHEGRPHNYMGHLSNRLCWGISNIQRYDEVLVSIVEEMGEAANDKYASLKVVEIPDDVQFDIMDYDGAEWVAEKHRTWC